MGLLLLQSTPQVPATVPTGFRLTPGNAEIMIAWAAEEQAESYRIYYSDTAGVTKSSAYIEVGSSPVTDTNVVNGQQRYYRLSAVNEVGESELSNEASGTPQGDIATGTNDWII